MMDGASEFRDGGKTNILIVDDLPEKHVAYRTVLEELGQNIVEAHSGVEALKQVLHQDFAVILLDVNMPGMDGFETARLIHQRKRSASTPIIFLTAFVDEVRMAEGYATGAVDYLPTPIVPGILRAKVRVFVDLFEMRRKTAKQAEERAKQIAVEDANRRLSFLADASAKLGRSLDIKATAQEVARLPVPLLADVSALKMSAAMANDNRVLIARNGTSELLSIDDRDGTGPLSSKVRTVINHVMQTAEYELLELERGIVIPLQARGRTIAVLALIAESATEMFNSNDISLAEAFAYRAAMALDNALLHEELRLADRQKNDFLSMLAHELRNPLAPIRNAAQLLERNTSSDPDIKWACEVIDRQVFQLVRLVDDLLDVARVTRDKISLHREPIELSSIVALAVEASRPVIDSRKHKLHVSCAHKQIWIDGDLARLTQVLTNLLNNAAKFTEEAGQIWLTTSLEESSAVIRVKDTGIGIPPPMLESVFNPFSQIHRRLDQTNEGLGIGLTLVRRLVEKHDGTVEAHSEGPGYGSEFIVRLPAIVAPATKPAVTQPKEVVSNATGTRRILVVDDNQDSAQSMAMMLRVMGHQTRAAYDGIEAIDVVSTYKPDLILLDIGLPQLNGYEVCRRVREQFNGDSIAIVALTGWGQEEDQRRSAEAGFDRHLVKPVDLDALKEVVAALKSPNA